MPRCSLFRAPSSGPVRNRCSREPLADVLSRHGRKLLRGVAAQITLLTAACLGGVLGAPRLCARVVVVEEQPEGLARPRLAVALERAGGVEGAGDGGGLGAR